MINLVKKIESDKSERAFKVRQSDLACYSAFEHFRKSLFSSDSDLYLMLTAYFDDSGTSPQNKMCIVAGYLSSVALWEQFVIRWSALLDQYDLEILHRNKLEAFEAEFKFGWNNDRRKEFLQKAHKIIKDCTYAGFGHAIKKTEYEEIIPQDSSMRSFGGVYGWCALNCLIEVDKWCYEHNYKEPIQFIFEAGTTGQGQVNKMFETFYADIAQREKYHIAGWSFQGKTLAPLQAADTAAYEFFRFSEDFGVKNIRLSASDLFRDGELQYFKTWDREAFLFWLKLWDKVHTIH